MYMNRCEATCAGGRSQGESEGDVEGGLQDAHDAQGEQQQPDTSGRCTTNTTSAVLLLLDAFNNTTL